MCKTTDAISLRTFRIANGWQLDDVGAAAVSAVDNACCYHILLNKLTKMVKYLELVFERMTIHAYSNANAPLAQPKDILQWNDAIVIQLSLEVTHSFCGDWLQRFIVYEFFSLSFESIDAPTIRLHGAPQIDLEEGKDQLVLRCEADANPPASIVWKRAGRSEIASLQVSTTLIDFSFSNSSFRLHFRSLCMLIYRLLMPCALRLIQC